MKDSLRVFIIERCHKCDILISWCMSLSPSEIITQNPVEDNVVEDVLVNVQVNKTMSDWMSGHYSGHVSCMINKGFLWPV